MPSYIHHSESGGVDLRAAAPRIYTTFGQAREHYDGVERGTDIVALDPACSLVQLARLYWSSGPADRFVFNGDARLVTLAALLKRLLPGRHGQLVAVDLVLRVPATIKARLAASWRRWAWRRVDLFIHYFKELDGYSRYYGIEPANSSYLPFKSNLYRDAVALKPTLTAAEGDYIFSAGRSLRDYQTLVEAARITGLPVAILFTSEQDWATHGTFLDRSRLPANLTLIRDDGSKEGWLNGLKRARLVVVPTRPESICASGIGTYLDAMALGKPVIITRGPGADDVLSDEAACFVAPQDAQSLAAAMCRLWQEPELATQQAERGRKYALGLGGEQALLQRIFSRVMAMR